MKNCGVRLSFARIEKEGPEAPTAKGRGPVR